MDNSTTEPLDSNPSSLHGLYTNFDDWVIKYNSCFKRSIRQDENFENRTKQLTTDNILIEDNFTANILLRQRHNTHSAKRPCVNFKENDGFMFYDHILFKLLNQNGGSRIILVRSKL